MVPGSDIESVHINRECVKGEADYVYTRRAQKATG